MKTSFQLGPLALRVGMCAGLTLAYPTSLKAVDAPPEVSQDGLQLKCTRISDSCM